MRIVILLAAALLLSGCGNKPNATPTSPQGYLMEKSTLPPDTMALRIAQQFAPGGVSNQVRLLALHEALASRNRGPSHSWSVERVALNQYLVKAKLTALERQDLEFKWTVDLTKPAEQVCVAASKETENLEHLHFKLDETGLEDFLGPVLKPAAPATPEAPKTP